MTVAHCRILLTALGLLLAGLPIIAGAGSATAAAAEPFVTAHRGASAYAPENTLAAVRLGVEMGADMVEIDVRRTKEDELVAVHDATLARTTNAEQVYPHRAPWRVDDFTLAELAKLDAGGWKAPRYAGEQVSTLSEVLQTLAEAKVGLMLEVKEPSRYPGIARNIMTELSTDPYWRHATDPQRLLIVSSDSTFQRALHQLAPRYPIGLIGTPRRGDVRALADWADFVNVEHTELDPDLVDRIHAAGMSTAPWTVDRPADMRRMVGYRVDGITTNRPDVLRSVLDGH